PSLRETGGLLVGGLRTRALLATRQGGRTLWADGLRLAVVLLLGLRIGTYTMFVGLFRPAVAPVPSTVWFAPVLLTLAVLAVVRGATRSGLMLILAGGIASMPWSMPSGPLLRGIAGADPSSRGTALLVLAALLLIAVRVMQRAQGAWSWWLAAAVVAVPLLDVSAHQWYLQDVLARLDAVHYRYFSSAEVFLDSVLALAVPAVLISLAVIVRDPRPSIAAAVSAGAGVLAGLSANAAVVTAFPGFGWSSFLGDQVQPTVIIAVGALTTAATIRTGRRFLRH
ncbi:MAG: hypothetical protein ACREQ5_37035, partial [Candidatus Dormibacteria bacterium]